MECIFECFYDRHGHFTILTFIGRNALACIAMLATVQNISTDITENYDNNCGVNKPSNPSLEWYQRSSWKVRVASRTSSFPTRPFDCQHWSPNEAQCQKILLSFPQKCSHVTISHTSHTFNGNLVRPLLASGRGWKISSHNCVHAIA